MLPEEKTIKFTEAIKRKVRKNILKGDYNNPFQRFSRSQHLIKLVAYLIYQFEIQKVLDEEEKAFYLLNNRVGEYILLIENRKLKKLLDNKNA